MLIDGHLSSSGEGNALIHHPEHGEEAGVGRERCRAAPEGWDAGRGGYEGI